MARAIWKGRLLIGKAELGVKMYAAVQDRTVHFRLLDKESLAPVHQRIVRKTDGKEAAKDERRKALALDEDRMVMLTAEELEELEPKPSREIELCRFVAPSLVGDMWYDRPYYLGPDDDEKDYFALVAALERSGRLGIARWVMRGKRYVGALTALEGYLSMVTLRRAEQVLSLPAVEPRHEPDKKELKLARQLVEAAAGKFEPQLWQDEYHERVCRLIEAKAAGKTLALHAARRKRAAGGLAEQLRRSLAHLKEKKAA